MMLYVALSHFKARGGGRHGMNANVKCRFLCGLRPNEAFLYFQLKIDKRNDYAA